MSANDDNQKKMKKKTNPRVRSAFEKAELVIEAGKLKGEELGAFLRGNGLHEADLEQMQRWLADRLDPVQMHREKVANKKAERASQKRISKLEKELRRKDKALAEAAALLVLQKKVQQMWGDEDDDTDPNNGSKS